MGRLPGPRTAAAAVDNLKRAEPTKYVKGIREWIGRRIAEDRLQTIRAEDVALMIELDLGTVKGKSGPASQGSLIRFLARSWILLTLALFILMAVWKYKDDMSFVQGDSLVLLNLVMGSLQGLIYLAVGTSFVYHLIFAVRKVRSLDRGMNRRRRVACTMASLDGVCGLVTISAFIAGNAVTYAHEGCGYFLGSVKVLTGVRSVALGAILANQMCLAIISMPVQLMFKIIDFFRAGWLVRLFDEQDSLREVVLGIDLPSWVFLLVFTVYFVPWVAMLVVFLLGFTGPLGGHWCTSIYDTRCYPGATEDLDCHQWSYPCNAVSSTSRSIAIAMAAYALLVLITYFITIITTSWYLKRLPYTLYRTSHTEVGFQLTTRFYTTLMFLLTVCVLWLGDSSGCDPHVLLLVGFLPVEMVFCYLVSTTLIVRTPYFIDKEDFNAMSWDRTFLWSNGAVAAHQRQRPVRSQKSVMCFERALQAFYFSWVTYDIEEKPSSMFTIAQAMQLHNLSEFKLLWKHRLDAKAIVSWNKKTKTVVVAVRGTASGKNACTDLKFIRSAHLPTRGSYWRGSQPLIHSGFGEFWVDSGLRDDVLALIDNIMEDHGGRGENVTEGGTPIHIPAPSKPWEVWCYGHSLGGAAAKLAALDIHHHLEQRGLVSLWPSSSTSSTSPSLPNDSHFMVSCYTYGCPYVGNRAFADDFEKTIGCAWDLFHPNDVVSITGKWYFMYARCSQVCLVSRFGDLVLNPSGLERTSLHPLGLKRVSEHLLSTYAQSLLSIVEKWNIIDEYTDVSSKREDTLDNLVEDNPAVVDVLTLLESISVTAEDVRLESDSVGSGDEDKGARRPASAGEQMLQPLFRAWRALDLQAIKVKARIPGRNEESYM